MDPVYAGLFDPQQWNRYAYARNNPLGFVDPDGRNLAPLDRPTFRVDVEGCYSCDMSFFIQMQLMWYFPGIYGSGLVLLCQFLSSISLSLSIQSR